MSESECVVEEGGREGGRGADTELKTKTPHVNVGNNLLNLEPKGRSTVKP